MKKLIAICFVLCIVASFSACATLNPKESPALAQNMTATLTPDGTITVSGAGFPVGQEVQLMIITVDGVTNNIGYALNPQPVADKKGAWSTTWSFGRLVKKQLIQAGALPIYAVDEDYTTLAETAIQFTY